MANLSYPIYLGKIDMSLEMFYDGYESSENKDKYNLCSMLVPIIDKYPPTTKNSLI